MSTPEQPAPGVSEEVKWKNRLQEFTQRASIPLPTYKTNNEGSPHAPQFRSQVWVDETCFVSPHVFPNRKMAEQDVAKHAFLSTLERVKNQGSSIIREDTVFGKMIINEYALKMNQMMPTYVTNESKTIFPVFVSSLVLNDVTYVGDAAKSKKEAEQLAARSAILSILESESNTTMSEIVKSKFRFYEALKKVKDFSSNCGAGDVPAAVGPTDDSSVPSSVIKRKEVDISGDSIVTAPFASTPQSTGLLSFPVMQIMHPELTFEQVSQNTQKPVHEFKRPKSGNSVEFVPTPPPIEFVPASSEQGLISSTPGKKKNRKNKKAKKKTEFQSPLSNVVSQSSVPACSVAQ